MPSDDEMTDSKNDVLAISDEYGYLEALASRLAVDDDDSLGVKIETPPLNPANIPPDAIPQERFTGDVLRGYGPRRGNLEKLLRYWRPIMRREGGFRRCLAILADHPELYPLENLCAWLHHETTGLWPNEGCHHPGMKNCRRKLKRIANGSLWNDSEFNSRMGKLRRLTGGKNAYMEPTEDELAVAGWALKSFIQEEKDFVDYISKDDNWHYVGDDEDGNEVEYQPLASGDHDDDHDCGCGCGGSGGCKPMSIPDDAALIDLLLRARRGGSAIIARRRLLTPAEVDLRAGLHMEGRRAAARRFVGAGRFGGPIRVPMSTDEPIMAKERDGKSLEMVAEVKVGLFGSHDPVVQGAESVVSTALPGDLGPLRSPVRSGLYRGLTPGGGGSRGGLGRRAVRRARQQARCPAGFELGGTFTNEQFSTCGEQLFDTPDYADETRSRLGRLARRARQALGAAGAGVAGTPGTDTPSLMTSRDVPVGAYGALRAASDPGARDGLDGVHIPTLSRKALTDPSAAQRLSKLPKAGEFNPEIHNPAVELGIKTAKEKPVGFIRLVRADGITLDAVVSIDRLADQRKNRDMDGGTIITVTGKQQAIGQAELATMALGVRSVVMIQPGGGYLRVDAVQPLSTVKAGQVKRRMNAVVQGEGPLDHAVALQKVVGEYPQLRYSENFPGIDKPNEIVQIERGDQKSTAKRWAYEAFLAEKAPGRSENEEPWKEVGAIAQDDAKAIAPEEAGADEVMPVRLNDGVPVENVPAKQRPDALNESSKFKTSDIGGGRTLQESDDETLVLHGNSTPEEAISMRVAADIGRAIEANVPTVRFAGEKEDRRALVSSAAEAIEGAQVSTATGINELPSYDLIRILIADYLTDNRRRSPASIAAVSVGRQKRAVAMPTRAALFGAAKSNDDLSFPEFMDSPDGGSWAKGRLAREKNVKASQQVVDAAVEKAAGFDWEAYIGRLSLDGPLSNADKAHLDALRGFYADRLTKLRAAKDMFEAKVEDAK